MFSIRLRIANTLNLNGLDALDMRRVLKLPDGVKLRTSYPANSESPAISVSEGFARLHFGRSDTSASRDICPKLLSAGDVVVSDGDTNYLRFAPDISDDRIRELWLSAGK